MEMKLVVLGVGFISMWMLLKIINKKVIVDTIRFLVMIVILQLLIWQIIKRIDAPDITLIYLVIQFISASMYLRVNKKGKPEEQFYSVYESIEKPLDEIIINALGGCFVMAAKWAELYFLIRWFIKIIFFSVNFKYNPDIMDLSMQILVLSAFLLFVLDTVSFFSNVKRIDILMLSISIIIVGLFNSKWWTGIGLLVTILGTAISKEFVERNINTKAAYDFDDSVLKLFVPYVAFLGYVSLIVVQEIFPREKYIIIFINFISESKLDLNSMIDKFFIGAYLGISEIALFALLWFIIKFKLINSNITNDHFKRQFELLETSIIGHWKRSLKKTSLERRNLDEDTRET